jgi:uncharacterized membrane protein YkoI
MRLLLALALLALPAAVPAQRRSAQDQAYAARREGRILPLRDIERRVVPTMQGADYMGFDFDGGAGVYTLKFLRDGAVIWVEVDGRTGQVLGRSGR